MGFNTFFKIMIIETAILMSAFAYAAEDHLSISPSTEAEGYGSGYAKARAGELEITISGDRNSSEVVVVWMRYSVIHRDCPTGPTNCIPNALKVTATIKEGENPGKSSYERKFPISLEPGTYSVSLYISDLQSDYEPVYADGVLLFVREDPIPLHIENSTGELNGSDSFTLRNIAVPGHEETFWGLFRWNPKALSFELEDAGVETIMNDR